MPHFYSCFRATLVASLVLLTTAGAGEASVRLAVEHEPDGGDLVTIEFARWPNNVWMFRAPAYLVTGNRFCGPLISNAVLNSDGSVTVSGTNAQPDSATYEFVLTPHEDTVDIEATVTNSGTLVWSPGAFGVASLESIVSSEFSGGRTAALLHEKLATAPELDVHQRTVDPFTYDGGTLRPRDMRWFKKQRHKWNPGNRAIVIRSSGDGKRHIAIGFENAYSVASTPGSLDCIRVTPNFGPLGVGRTGSVRGRIYLFAGDTGELVDAFKRDFPEQRVQSLPSTTDRQPRYETTHDVSAEVVEGTVRVSIARSAARGRERVTIFRRNVAELRLGGTDRQVLTHVDTTGSIAIKALPMRGRRRYFTDPDVQPATTYAYWIRSRSGITQPVAVRVRDDRIWWGKREVSRTIDTIARKYPGRVDVARYGRTTQGWNIRGLRTGNPKVTVALVGSVHAGESGPEIILPLFERLLAEEGDLLDDVGIAILPLVNADERQKLREGTPWYLRKNSAGVDINRNFDADWEVVNDSYGQSTADPNANTYRGPRPESESETRAVMSFVEKTRPAVVLSFHGLTSATGPMFVTAVRGSEEYYRRTLDVARAYQSGYSGESSMGRDVPPQTMRRSVSGSLALWVSLQFGVPAADLEFTESPEMQAAVLDLLDPDLLDDVRERHYRAVKSLLEYLRDEKLGASGR